MRVRISPELPKFLLMNLNMRNMKKVSLLSKKLKNGSLLPLESLLKISKEGDSNGDSEGLYKNSYKDLQNTSSILIDRIDQVI